MRFIYFPAHPQRAWTMALGVTATTMPYEVTEELHYRIPALEISVLRRLPGNFSLYGRASVQGFQNYIAIGPRWSVPVTKRTSIGLSDETAFWFGFNNFEGFKTSATGLQNFPALSAGIRFKKQVLLTLRAEAILTLGVNSHAGDIKIASRYKTGSGSAYTVMLEQPFYGKKRMALGFRAAYTSFFWQTWSAFSTYDRNFFYPQLIACITW
ncbi:MAG: hypothetical protein EOP50_05050 [Sphingobacteriales bacterium]|nr:MAG: hypothetical protein EOP50_05050 [Sphingobacteriales bacterium]